MLPVERVKALHTIAIGLAGVSDVDERRGCLTAVATGLGFTVREVVAAVREAERALRDVEEGARIG